MITSSNNNCLLIVFILTACLSLISSIVIISNPVVSINIYAKKSFESSDGGDPNDNNTNNNNPSLRFSTTLSLNCNNTNQNISFCREQQQLRLRQQINSQSYKLQPDDTRASFHPEQMKCKPDPITGKCQSGFSMNVNQHCYPDKPCPNGFESMTKTKLELVIQYTSRYLTNM